MEVQKAGRKRSVQISARQTLFKKRRHYMKRGFTACTVALAMVILSSPFTPQAAGQAAPATEKAVTSSAKAKPSAGVKAGSAAPAATSAKPQSGGVYKVIIRSRTNAFGYPPRIAGAGKDYAPPFFDHLFRVGEDGKYKPGLALSWDTSKDGKTITFKLRQGVQFHDGTPFNAQAVKANLDNLIPPKAKILSGVAAVDVVDEYTVKLQLTSDNNLILHHFAVNPATYMYSPEALRKNGADWANTHPVGTGPFALKDYQPNISLTLVKNPHYWQKGLPHLDGIEIAMVPDPMTQVLAFKAGQANAIYDAPPIAAVQLRDAGYPLKTAFGGLIALTFDTRNSEIFSKRKVRQAIEHAIDKEAICDGPGEGLYKPMYQVVDSASPDYEKAIPPRKYDPAMAKKLLAEAGYPNGFSFRMFLPEATWRDGWVAVQSYLEAVGIKMEINLLNVSSYNLIRAGGKIEPGAAAFAAFFTSTNTLFALDYSFRSDSAVFQYMVRPAGIDKLIDQAKLSRDPAAATKINRQTMRLIHDDQTMVPLWQTSRIAVVDRSVQNTGWFIDGDPDNNEFGTRTWLKK
jgi:peptide/nickel transport system substrate-binding protein